MLIGTISCYHLIPIPVALTLAWSQLQWKAKPVGFIFSTHQNENWYGFGATQVEQGDTVFWVRFSLIKGNNCYFTVSKTRECWHAFSCVWLSLVETLVWWKILLNSTFWPSFKVTLVPESIKLKASVPIISQSSFWIYMDFDVLLRFVSLMNLILILSCLICIEGRDLYLSDFALKKPLTLASFWTLIE